MKKLHAYSYINISQCKYVIVSFLFTINYWEKLWSLKWKKEKYFVLIFNPNVDKMNHSRGIPFLFHIFPYCLFSLLDQVGFFFFFLCMEELLQQWVRNVIHKRTKKKYNKYRALVSKVFFFFFNKKNLTD